MSLVKSPIVYSSMIGLEKPHHRAIVPNPKKVLECDASVEGTICVADGSPCTATFVGDPTFRAGAPRCHHGLDEPTTPPSQIGKESPEHVGKFLRFRRSGCGRSSGGDCTSKPTPCEEGRTR